MTDSFADAVLAEHAETVKHLRAAIISLLHGMGEDLALPFLREQLAYFE